MQAKTDQTGQVFAFTLAPPASVAPGTPQAVPDICLGATSAFGIQIVRPGPDGRALRRGFRWFCYVLREPGRKAQPG